MSFKLSEIGWFSGADLGGGCRDAPPPHEMTCGFLIQLAFCKKKKTMWFIGISRARDECTPSWKKSWIRPWFFWSWILKDRILVLKRIRRSLSCIHFHKRESVLSQRRQLGKCTKKRDARAQLFNPLPFSLPSLSLLQLPNFSTLFYYFIDLGCELFVVCRL